jgi:ribonuclease J
MKDNNNQKDKVSQIFSEDKNAAKNESQEKLLRVINVGDSVTKNLTIYEYEEDIIAVDFGIGFPEDDSMGIDYIVPDMTYLLDNSHKFKALLITHAHSDHFAAVPHLLQQVNVPIYANKMAQGYIREELKEKQFKELAENVKFHELDYGIKDLNIGVFKISTFGVNHSVPGSLGIVIDTPEGRMLHIADFKLDESPIMDPPIDLDEVKALGDSGVLSLASDCMGVRSRGFVTSEKTLIDTFPKLFDQYDNSQIFVTSISTNIARMQLIIEAAVKRGKKIVPTGRSIDSSIRVATNAGYLSFPEDVYVDLKKASEYTQDSLVYIIAGCFGQPGSAVDRLSKGNHRDIQIEQNSVLIFSAEPNPPGVQLDVERVKSDLTLRGVEVLDHMNTDNLHVSGHGHRGDLSKIAELVKPKYFIPIGGTAMQIHSYANMVYDMGFPKGSVFEVQEGDVVEFKDGQAKFGERIPVTDMFIDGTSISPVVIKDRRTLSDDGVFVVIVPMDSSGNLLADKVDVVTRGFIYVKGSQELMNNSRKFVAKSIKKHKKKKNDLNSIRKRVENDVEKFLYKETARRPLVIVHAVNI